MKPIDKLKTVIRENRPNISGSSVLTYSSLLKSMYMSQNDSVDNMDVDWFKNKENVMRALEGKPAHARKTSIASLVVLLGKDSKVDDEVIDMMNKDVQEVKERYAGQKMTDKQRENWMSLEDVQSMEAKALDLIKPWLNKKAEITPEQQKMLTDWLLLALTTGVYFPPRRSEWAGIKLKDVDTEKDNYIDLKKGVFVLSQYKTAKLYGREEIPYGKVFGGHLKKVLKLIPDQTYLLENKGKPFTNSLITTRLNKLFGKNISTSMLRHIFVSDKYKDIPSIKELEETADAMGHSVRQNMEYILRK